MKRWRSYFLHILIFIFAQLAWLALIALWIYWYVSNYIIFSQVGQKLAPQMMPEGRNIFALVSGLVLMVAISAGMWLLFRRLSIQYHMTLLYDNFIANVTHELKTPLASIQLYLETMARRELPRPKQEEFLALMLKDTQRLNSLINAILEMPALEQKRIAHKFAVHAANPLFYGLFEEAREQFQIEEEVLTVQGTLPCQCVADRNALRIALFNLIDNSIKYRHGPLRISISLRCTEKTIQILFADQGIGIEEGEQKKIFDKFYRSHSDALPSVRGTGLGLYWVREIMRFHGGEITVSSPGRYGGSVFRLELPIYRLSKRRQIEKLLAKSRRKGSDGEK
ncbi:MAG TPA: HAMP domain-containing sensor histidine kinase [bacterium]|nr:HAMP domain-containing sensor histidine kinase [bacterium]HQG44969.1 HAMP domain-containing sensor histidine kinase [bacterium]HQI49129.1 HAMP domain-containing sensor histidine kinase [bacterium]HQJ62990.1 HAMP domain-containing sensor histidine kinase [bacterium]